MDLTQYTGARTITSRKCTCVCGGRKDLEQNVLQQVSRIKNHPYVHNIPVRGFIYDVKTGKLNEVKQEAARVAC
jgi:carbonic anhydrase